MCDIPGGYEPDETTTDMLIWCHRSAEPWTPAELRDFTAYMARDGLPDARRRYPLAPKIVVCLDGKAVAGWISNEAALARAAA
jgi:hypothetical protein